jgi:hypothetical protein
MSRISLPGSLLYGTDEKKLQILSFFLNIILFFYSYFLCVKVLVSGNSSPSREVATILSTGKLFHIYFVDNSSGGVWVEECLARWVNLADIKLL